ncbi:hydroxyethylthiazole kinase [Paenibacillus sp. FSL H8-0548]|uniref:hydroxyethylthiazole kinase n=1 Tax=Paenibacillus sp. FSL H8-0548 TaxID=1920422 RepID=UPI00096EA405|nr:hydroxyethylthiazole kinase [Paenibacillus sp. FSL H8-0548]OMF29775.1 hydroxyethylthiazole kinase [Paenibacillus sp. FSL H8-0548]
MNFLNKVREQNPLIHNITNIVVANFTANGLLALGASPFMAYAHEEVADVAKMASAVVLNIGTLDEQIVQACLIAGKSANEHHVPVVFDPVGAGATAYRTASAHKIIAGVKIAVLRGNVAEIAHIAGESWTIKGVDAGTGDGDTVALAQITARKLGCIVVITGKEDVITDGEVTFLVSNGHPLLTKITGAGCLLSSVVGAFLAVGVNASVVAAAEAVAFYGLAAEKAYEASKEQGPGSFQTAFIDQLSIISACTLKREARLKQLFKEEA